MTPEQDAIHDILLTGLGYMPAYNDWGVIHVARDVPGAIDAFNIFYYQICELPLKDGYYWGSFLPPGSPESNWNEWKEKAIQFLSDPDGYVEQVSSTLMLRSDWTDVNIDNGAQDNLANWQRDNAIKMDLCSFYDWVWPRITLNYRSMEGVFPVVDEDVWAKVAEKIRINPDLYKSIPSPERLITPLAEGEDFPCPCCLDS